MKQYRYSLSPGSRKHRVFIEDESGEEIAQIDRTVLRNCERRNTYSYTSAQGSIVKLGLKKRKFRDMNISKYILQTDQEETVFKERPGSNLLHFRVDGKIDGRFLSIEEDWAGDMEVYYHGRHVATVMEDVATRDTLILSDPQFDGESLQFSIVVLMYFMFKLYKRESWQVADILP